MGVFNMSFFDIVKIWSLGEEKKNNKDKKSFIKKVKKNRVKNKNASKQRKEKMKNVLFICIICLNLISCNAVYDVACDDFKENQCYVRTNDNPFTTDKICVREIKDGYMLYDKVGKNYTITGLSQRCKLFGYKNAD